ncbi:hypothetical protein RRF57_007562 [Xylaria bambusicola]|uniref:Protein kinase domain-containing protein n=1 Tax=Xylaria bambusicola TaxID=326684 RepID=A0AAN7US72_9PEZI
MGCASEHICRYYGAFVDAANGTISIAMEFCEGGSLDSIYKEVKKLGGRTGEKVLGKIAEGVLSGLTYLNDKKIMHRDIKPSNILLCRTGEVKLCDFGVSGEFGTKGDANTFIGTSYYMAPERITGQAIPLPLMSGQPALHSSRWHSTASRSLPMGQKCNLKPV